MNPHPFSASLMFAIQKGAEEIIGEEGTSELCREAQLAPGQELDLAAVKTARQAINVVYGEFGGAGLALRIGRAACQTALREFGALNGLTALEFRLQPSRTRLRSGLEKFAELFSRPTELVISAGENDQGWFWRVEGCPERAASSGEAGCSFWVGMLQEYFSWCSAGKLYRVVETECAAAGDNSCCYQIYRQPLE